MKMTLAAFSPMTAASGESHLVTAAQAASASTPAENSWVNM